MSKVTTDRPSANTATDDSQKGIVASHGLFTLIKARFSDFDLQGVLNSRQYLDLVAEARLEQMERYYKLPIELYTQRKQSWMLSQFAIDYLKPIYYPTAFFVSTKIESIDRSKAHVSFSFCSQDKTREFAKGQVVYHLLDMETRKPTSIPENEKEVYLNG
jgi:thioesterase III